MVFDDSRSPIHKMLISFSGSSNDGDVVLLSLTYSGGNVVMFAKDWNTSSTAEQTYSAMGGSYFRGLIGANGDDNGFFTGLMTEWYHVNPYYGDQAQVVYSNSVSALSAGIMWADEWVPENGTGLFNELRGYSFSNPNQLLYYPPHGCACVLAANGYQFVTGAVWTTKTWTVDDNGLADFFAIQKAIDAAAPRDTIVVFPGIYSETVYVYKSISLLGQNKSQTIIKKTLPNAAGVVIRASNVTLSGFTIQRNGDSIDGISVDSFYAGPLVSASCGENISYNIITGFGIGIPISGSANNTIYGNDITNCGRGISMSDSSNNSTISSNNITNTTSVGIYFSNCNNNNVLLNTITNSTFPQGIWLDSSSNNNISLNTITNSTSEGIDLTYSSNNNIVSLNNIMTSSNYGIYLMYSSNNSVSLNNLNNANVGIEIADCSNNRVFSNTITNSELDGIWLDSSYNNDVFSNKISNSNSIGIEVWKCIKNSVSLNSITNCTYGIQLYSSSNNNVSSNNVTKSNTDGISLTADSYQYSSTNNRITLNNVTNSAHSGISLTCSSHNGVFLNSITNSTYGIYLISSNNSVSLNTITASSNGIFISSSNNRLSLNNITNNNCGIYLHSSSGNLFFHNNLIGNTVQASVNAPYYPNFWNDSYPSGGNYWSNYNVNDSNHDGIGDTPYVIDASNVDNYPLMSVRTPVFGLDIVKAWYWSLGSVVSSVALGDVDGNGQVEVVTGGYYFDGVRDIAQMCVWNGSNGGFEQVTTWFWTGNTTINSVAIGDVNGDGQIEIVTGGSYFDGTRYNAQLIVWNGSSLAVEKLTGWFWTGNTVINSVAAGDVDGDGHVEIVTGGSYFDGVHKNAQLIVWDGSNLSLKRVTCWKWTGDTVINSVGIGDVNADGQTEIVTGGSYFDGSRNNAQLVVWNGTTLAAAKITGWYWTSNTVINSVELGDVDGDGHVEIVSGGYYNDGTRNNAQLIVWNGTNLTVERITGWYWTSNTVINSVAIGDVNFDGQAEIVTAGQYNDGSRDTAQLAVWSGSNLTAIQIKSWYWTSNTEINSVTIGDINNDLSNEIVTGGSFYDETRLNSQLTVWVMS
jgi:parallel beta-helix repeat protein